MTSYLAWSVTLSVCHWNLSSFFATIKEKRTLCNQGGLAKGTTDVSWCKQYLYYLYMKHLQGVSPFPTLESERIFLKMALKSKMLKFNWHLVLIQYKIPKCWSHKIQTMSQWSDSVFHQLVSLLGSLSPQTQHSFESEYYRLESWASTMYLFGLIMKILWVHDLFVGYSEQ